MLPAKAKEERKYPHVTADPTWMRLIISHRSHVVSQILCSSNTTNPVQPASVAIQSYSKLSYVLTARNILTLLLLDTLCALQLFHEVPLPIYDSTQINKYHC